jgi:AraC family transcriptional regulator, melibiose operon regulatory protein
MDTLTFVCDFLKSANINSFIWRYYINEFEAGWSMPEPHAHKAIEVEFVLDGTGFLKFKNDNIKIVKNNCIIIFSNVPHYFYVSENRKCKMINIHFDLSETNLNSIAEETIEQFPDNFLLNIIFNKDEYMKLVDHNDIENLMRNIVLEMDKKKSNYEVLVKMYFCELLIIISRIISNKKTLEDKSSKYVKDSKDFIDLSLSMDLSPEIIASAIHISADYLLHIFKEYTGYSLMEYVTVKRIEKAKELLKNSSQNITIIANQVGIPNSQYFSTLFKRYTSYTPNQFRKISSSINNGNTNIFR